MPPFPFLLANVVIAILLLVAASSSRALPPAGIRRAALAALPLLDAALLAAFVFSGDTYRDTGISRWDAYRSPGGALAPMFVASLVLLALASAAIAATGFVARAGVVRLCLALAGLGGLLLVSPTLIGFSTN